MLAVRKLTPSFGLSLVEVDPPRALNAGEVLIEVDAAGICGSDVHVYEWTPGYEFMQDSLPVTIGHEFAGRIAALGPGVQSPTLGTAVVVAPSHGCGVCPACHAAHEEFCAARTTIGWVRDGAFARLVIVPARQCFTVPQNLDPEVAALTEPLSVGAQAVKTGGVTLGDNVVVLGAGMIGLSIALMARRAGAARVMVVGKSDEKRLSCAKDLGFKDVVDLDLQPLKDAVQKVFDGPVDVAFEATGVPSSLTDGLSILRRGGILVTTGIHSKPAQLPLTTIVRGKYQIRGSHSAARDIWPAVIRLLASEPDSYRKLISHRLKIQDAITGFELSRRREAVKVIIVPGAQ
jgi:2-desacetyl-2-hydroxyethyl bacteriochlorophyllide A dehydrogenase